MSSEYDIIPGHILNAINAYAVRGQDPGHFIKAVAENDLLNAVNYGDEDCMRALKKIVQYFYSRLPHACWGDAGRVAKWMRQRGTILSN